MRRMYAEQENVFYYITTMNENYVHPALPEGAEEGILKGMYRLPTSHKGDIKMQLFGSGTILREVEAAAAVLEADYGVSADVWSVTSFSELRRDGIDCERWNTRHPEATPRNSYVSQCLSYAEGPFVAATDYMRIVADQIREWVPGRYSVLGTDGFGRSDGRAALRRHFEVNRDNVVLAALKALADEKKIAMTVVTEAMAKMNIDSEKPNPVTC